MPLTVWDGEVQRQTTDGENIEPNSLTGWPAVKVEMDESGFDRLSEPESQTFEDSYGELGSLTIYIWDTTRESLEGTPATEDQPQVQGWITKLEVLFNNQDKVVGEGSELASYMGLSPSGDQYYFYKFNWRRWTCVQEKEVRAQLSVLLYRGEITFDCGVHGMIPSYST